MFSETLKIIPKMDGKDLGDMERTLNGRFARVAKKFGSGLMTVLKGGGIFGTVSLIVDKVLNPLQSVQEAIDRTLHTGDELSTFAKQFQTTAGNLARLQGFAGATGLDNDGLRMLLLKFQGAVAQAALTPGTPTAVSSFVGRADTAEAFFEFIQSMQKLTDVQKNLVQQEVFGERMIGRSASFFGANFKELNDRFNQLGVPSADKLTGSALWLGQMNDNKNLLDAARSQKDLLAKSRLVKDSTINSLGGRADFELGRENKNLGNFSQLERLQTSADKIISGLETVLAKVAPLLAPALESIPAIAGALMSKGDTLDKAMETVQKSRQLRGLAPGQGKDK